MSEEPGPAVVTISQIKAQFDTTDGWGLVIRRGWLHNQMEDGTWLIEVPDDEWKGDHLAPLDEEGR